MMQAYFGTRAGVKQSGILRVMIEGQSMIDFGREICGNLGAAASREWLVTNGIGGYAAGTVAGMRSRRYHGLLVAALHPPLGRTLLVVRLDERADYNGHEYTLFTDQRAGGAATPEGYQLLERFHLEGTTPVWTYALGDALLEKRIWMQRGANTTYVRYELRRAGQAAGQALPLTLTIDALVDGRDYHGMTSAAEWDTRIEELPTGLRVEPYTNGPTVFLLSDSAMAAPLREWRTGSYLALEAERGFESIEDQLCAGRFQAILHVGEALTLVLSTEPAPNLDGAAAYAERRRDEQVLLERSRYANGPDWAQQLVLAADQFIVARHEGQPITSTPNQNRSTPTAQPEGRSVIAGYPWFSDWGRDTMIALPGLTLATGRPEDARSILRTFARFVDRGMLPNRFPDAGETPEYNTVDAALWYVEALRAYHAATGDDATLRELFPVLREIIAWHIRGTRYGIKVDLADGLLSAGQADVQLTWMDVKIGEWVVTPRTGKAVEVNALWYNALCCMADFAQRMGLPGERYAASARQVRRSFGRFWNEAAACCYDVLDGPDGNDPTLRPNQVIAAALTNSPLDEAQARAIVETCARTLLTSHGLRTLPPDHPNYRGHFVGDWNYRDSIYHQGTVWGWLIGPFVQAHLRVYRDPASARALLAPLVRHLRGAGLGSISEVFDGDPPHAPRGCFAQAWSVAELLRVWQLIEN